MCLIIDADVMSRCFNGDSDFLPVYEALLRKKAIAFYGGKLADEYAKMTTFRSRIAAMDRIGAFKQFSRNSVESETKTVADSKLCRSNDVHIIALARVSHCRLLCSNDKKLHADFTNPKILKPKGSVYSSKKHSHLIHKHCK